MGGALLGRALAGHPRLESFKLLNIVGLTYDLVGLMVLSEVVAQSERLKGFVVNWVAGVLVWAQSVVPLGAALGAWFAAPAPSSNTATSFFISFWAYSLFLLVAIESTVFFPRAERFKNVSVRTRLFGLLLLVSGVFVQLVAAFKDLYG